MVPISKFAAAKPEPNTRETILQTAAHLFAQKGLHGVSVKDISQAAGTNTALLFYYFKSKRELYLSIHKEIVQEILNNLHELLDNDKPSVDNLKTLLRFIIDSAKNNSDLARITARELYGFGELSGEELVETYDAVLRPLEAIILQGIQEGVFKTSYPRGLAISILITIHFFTTTIINHEFKDPDTLLQFLSETHNFNLKPSNP